MSAALTLPELHPVQSSNIERVGHDDAGLYVRFKGGGLYRYSGVSADTFGEMRAADSVGTFFFKNIRGKYSHEIVEE